MRWIRPTLLFVVFLLTTIPLSYAIRWHFPTDVNIPQGIKYHFGDYWILSEGSSIKITAYFEDNWFNYTTNGGTQQIHNGTKPHVVYFDDVAQSEDDTWTYSDGTVTLTPSGTDVAILWSDTISQILVRGVQQAASVFGIVLILGMVFCVTTGKDEKYAIMLAVGSIMCLITVLVLSNMTILGA